MRRMSIQSVLDSCPYRGASTLVEEPLEHFGSFVTEADHSDALGPDLAFVSDSLSERVSQHPAC